MGKRQGASNRMFLRPSPNEEVCFFDIPFIVPRYTIMLLLCYYSDTPTSPITPVYINFTCGVLQLPVVYYKRSYI